jgi:hypothetical protein
MSWEDFDEQPLDSRPVTQAAEDINRLCLRVFGTEDGKELLGILRQWYVEPPVATPGSDPSYAFYREGQRFVVLDIETRLRRAING